VLLVCTADIDDSDNSPNETDSSVKYDRLSPGERGDEQDDLPVYLWRPGQMTDVIGEWEQHTRVSNSFHAPYPLQ